MAHQCLKCGQAYPDGSPQILKGCEACKGTRFFYTDQPLDSAARAAVAERTEADIERIALGKGTSERAPPRRIPTKDELPLGSGNDWVELGPNYLRNVVEDVVRRAGERKPVFRVGAPAPGPDKPTLAEWIREQGGATDEADETHVAPAGAAVIEAPYGDDLLDDLVRPERERAWREAAHGDDDAALELDARVEGERPAAPSADEVVYKRGPRRVPKPVSLAGVPVEPSDDDELREKARAMRERIEREAEELARSPPLPVAEADSLYPEGQRPETVGISAPGVYELDVKRLMEKSPIVVHKDGTYSLHLPSLMERVEKGKRRR